MITRITYQHVAQSKDSVSVLAIEVSSTIYIWRKLHPFLLAILPAHTPNNVRRGEGRHLLTTEVFRTGLAILRYHSVLVCLHINIMKVN